MSIPIHISTWGAAGRNTGKVESDCCLVPAGPQAAGEDRGFLDRPPESAVGSEAPTFSTGALHDLDAGSIGQTLRSHPAASSTTGHQQRGDKVTETRLECTWEEVGVYYWF